MTPTLLDGPEPLTLPGADLCLIRSAFRAPEADQLFKHLLDDTPWREDRIVVFGKQRPMPRLTAWYGEFTYTYTGIVNPAAEWTPALLQIKSRVEALANDTFTGVLMNLYRSGRDSVSWHSDDERELGVGSAIASVSFGATRRFQFRRKGQQRLHSAMDLHHGDVLIMRGATQQLWQHQIPKTTRPVGPRINLTFRRHLPG